MCSLNVSMVELTSLNLSLLEILTLSLPRPLATVVASTPIVNLEALSRTDWNVQNGAVLSLSPCALTGDHPLFGSFLPRHIAIRSTQVSVRC